MAITPADIHQLAVILQRQSNDGADSAALRSCISRAYYGALLSARDARQLSTVGAGGHDNVIDHYKNTGDPIDRAIADSLRVMKRLRKKADYDLNEDCTKQEGGDAMIQASKVKGFLKRAAPP